MSILSVQITGSRCFAHPATFTSLAEASNAACTILFFWQKSFMEIAFSRMLPRPRTRVRGGKRFLRCWTRSLCPATDWKCRVSLLLHCFKLNEQDECLMNRMNVFLTLFTDSITKAGGIQRLLAHRPLHSVFEAHRDHRCMFQPSL